MGENYPECETPAHSSYRSVLTVDCPRSARKKILPSEQSMCSRCIERNPTRYKVNEATHKGKQIMIDGALKAPLFSGRSKNEIGLIAVEGRLNQLGFTTIRKPRNGLPPNLFVEFEDGSRRKVHYKYSAEYDNFRMPNIKDISANDLLGLFLENEDSVKVIEGQEVIDKWKPIGDDGNLFFFDLVESPAIKA